MSSIDPILDDRWKVTDLRDELKRRKVVENGLKENSINSFDESVADGNAASVHHPTETEEVVSNGREKNDMQYGVTKSVESNDSAMVELPAGADSARVAEDLTSVTVSETGQDSVTKKENMEAKTKLECDLKAPCKHLMPGSFCLENQVSEVDRSLGSQVKSDSVCSSLVSINQKNELKDTIIANNVKLEQEIVGLEMVEKPSSRIDVSVYDELHLMDVELDEKKVSVEENSSTNKSPMNKTNSSEDVGYPEKLKLDRSSGDDPSEEDFRESKQLDSKFNVCELGEKEESVEVPIVKEEHATIVVGDGLLSEKGGTRQKNSIPSVPLAEKQKFKDRPSVENDKPAKRRRRWDSKTAEGSDRQISHAPKDRIVPQSQRPPTNSLRIDGFLRPFTLKAVHALLGNFTRFWMDNIKTHCFVGYSTVEEAIETRNAVYNLQWPPNGGRLLIAEYVEPEVIIKLESPLCVALVDNDSLPEPPPSQHREESPVPFTLPPPPPLRKLSPEVRELLPPPAARECLPPPPPLSKIPPPARDQLPLQPPFPEKVYQPMAKLNDIFPKTIATPVIYYLPLSKEQVAAKLAAKGRSTKQ